MLKSLVQTHNVYASELKLITSWAQEKKPPSNQDTGGCVKGSAHGLNTAQALQAQYSKWHSAKQ